MSPILDIISEAFSITWTVLFSLIVETVKSCWHFLFPVYKDLTNDIVLVTGAGSGIGRLMCLEFSKVCPTIIGWDINEASLKETAKLLAEQGCTLRTYVCDLRDRNAIIKTAHDVIREVGRVTVLVNNAGIVTGQTLCDLKPEEIEDCFKVNVFSHFYTMQSFLPHMIGDQKSTLPNPSGDEQLVQEPRGHIVTITSLAGLTPVVGLSDYCASKAASFLMSESFELELKKQNLHKKIHVTRVCPYLINTDMFKGCHAKPTWLFPNVDAHYCARRIVQAVRANEREVIIYKRYSILPLIKRLVPHNTTIKLYEIIGADNLLSQLKAHRVVA